MHSQTTPSLLSTTIVTINNDQRVNNASTSTGPVAWRRENLLEIFGDSISLQLPKPERILFCQMLMDYHKAFSLELEEDERGETDLVQLEIGDAPPKKRDSTREECHLPCKKRCQDK